MEKVVALISAAPETRAKNDDDFTDRLSSRYTVILLIVFCVVVSMNAYVGTPIVCWAPVHFTGSHTKYANSYCWVRNTYYLPWEDNVPRPHEERQMVVYYQWIPFILLGQALFFYLPNLVWHAFNSKAGVDCDNILETAHTLSHTDKEEKRDQTVKLLTNQIDRFLESRAKTKQEAWHCDFKHLLSATLCRCCGRRIGNYLVLLFLFSKLCYIGNAVAQFFVLNKLLGTEYNLYGIDVVKNMVADHDWTAADNVAFPRVTFCDFNVRRLGNVHRYTIQCTLPINLYNEKIYIFLWFWMAFVAMASLASLIIWSLRFMLWADKLRFIKNHLRNFDRIQTEKDNHMTHGFLENYLRQDGAFILRLIAHNTNNITTTEVICNLWDFWKEKEIGKGLGINDPSYGSPSAPEAEALELSDIPPKSGD